MGFPSWLGDAVFYEIYPQSFYDTNGDGIGDLPGVLAKLDYIQSLGATAIWLNPCFESPFQDAGYDISDFYKIAPRYGTNDDMKTLCREVHARGMKIVLDLVAGHTSIEHPWFKDACKGPGTKYSNYYIWTNGWGSPQGDYRFISGYGPRDGYYMINFFYCQPALNYGFLDPDPRPGFEWQLPVDHPDVQRVREELKNIMKFWLDLGCDGFRVDMASSLVRGNRAAEGIRDLWQYYRHWLDAEYPEAVLISEWSQPTQAVPAGFHIDFMVHFGQAGYNGLFRAEPERLGNGACPDFKRSFFDRCGLGDASEFFRNLTGNLKVTDGLGYVAVPTGNHDMGRIRAGRTLEELRAAYAFILLLPGVPFIYYGDEIGMNNVYGLGNKEGSYNRSAARTPMQWAPGAQGGFSSASPEQFYLPLDPAIDRPDVETQEKDPGSLLHFTRRMIALRHAHAALRSDGGFREVFCEIGRSPVVYERFCDGESFIVAVNPAGKSSSAQFALPNADRYRPVEVSQGTELKVLPGVVELTLPACGFAIYQREA